MPSTAPGRVRDLIGQSAERRGCFGVADPRRVFRQPKIKDFCLPAPDDKNVGGLDVSVKNSVSMGGIKCFTYLNRKGE